MYHMCMCVVDPGFVAASRAALLYTSKVTTVVRHFVHTQDLCYIHVIVLNKHVQLAAYIGLVGYFERVSNRACSINSSLLIGALLIIGDTALVFIVVRQC